MGRPGERCRPANTPALIFIAVLTTLGALDCSRKQSGKASQGAIVFQQKCAMCHATNSQTRAPLLESLRQMSKGSILTALQTGEMQAQGAKLTRPEREEVAEYLADPRTSGMLKGFCPANLDPPANAPVWNGWGVSARNARFQPESTAGIRRDQIPGLRLKWAFGFPGASATYGQPTVFGGKLYAGSEDGTVYSIDARTGCIWWTYQATATVKTAISIGDDGRRAFFGDTNGNVYAVSTSNGSLIWKVHPESHPAARITGSPLLHDGRLYVPISSGEEGAAADPKYPCCTFRGALVALDADDGKQIWKSYTIQQPAKPTRKNAAGVQMFGPSGAPLWSPPTISTERREIYVGTGNNYSDPPTSTSDAVMAFSLDSGKMLWWKQITGHDLWNIACVADTKANCPAKPGEDYDFGAPPILGTLSDGREVLLTAQKSGLVTALDPARFGRVIWQKRVAKGGPLGGIEWGGAASRRYAYYPLSDWQDSHPEAGGGLIALNIETGDQAWFTPAPKPACLNVFGCSAAQMAPPTATRGAVFAGSLDGHLRAYDSRTGAVIWDFDAAHNFKTVNGVKAHGGSFNNGGPAIANGMLYVSAGYTNELDGNVLLAFAPAGK
ncbi:MAG TPA: PQQ-binding-like beta-propeller repeat protein [Terriglobia bacterium]|nr:PQQ-binding-like beta-propeller repeat protein [Terriglobia bacterium]